MKTNLVAESEQLLDSVTVKISCFVNGSQINYLPQPSASVENFSQLTNHARPFAH